MPARKRGVVGEALMRLVVWNTRVSTVEPHGLGGRERSHTSMTDFPKLRPDAALSRTLKEATRGR